MSARSPTEVYLCVSKPDHTLRGLIKFTDVSLSSNIQWFRKDGPVSGFSLLETTAVTPDQKTSNQIYFASIHLYISDSWCFASIYAID